MTVIDVIKVREDFINAVYAECADDDNNDRANRIIDVFDSLPRVSEDLKIEQHGCWGEQIYDNDIFNYSFICSVCKKRTPPKGFVVSPNFCPYCGAKMDLEDE